MVGLLARLVLAGVLVAAAIAKAAGGRGSREGLATFGIESARAQAVTSGALIAVELALAAGVAAGSDACAWAAGLFMLGLSGALASAMARGRGGEPCSCFSARSRVGWGAVIRNFALAAGFAAIPFLPADEPTTEGWLAIGLAVALLACAGLGLAVLALAREIGVLRLRLGPGAALEIADEGPELGSRSEIVERFARDENTKLALAVFTSAGCHVCQGLAPAVELLRTEPQLAVKTFDEAEEPDAWSSLDVPGSPYAVAMAPDGTLLAKGTFNNLAQLESVVATAERRAAARLGVEALGV